MRLSRGCMEIVHNITKNGQNQKAKQTEMTAVLSAVLLVVLEMVFIEFFKQMVAGFIEMSLCCIRVHGGSGSFGWI